MVAVKGEKGFWLYPIQKDYQVEGVVAQEIRAVIKAVNMGLLTCKHCQTLGMFGDGATRISCCIDGI